MARRSLSKEEQIDLKHSRVMEALVASEGWTVFCAIVDAMVFNQTINAMKKCTSLDDAISREGDKGTIIGLKLARGLPDSIISAAKDIVSQLDPDDEPAEGDE